MTRTGFLVWWKPVLGSMRNHTRSIGHNWDIKSGGMYYSSAMEYTPHTYPIAAIGVVQDSPPPTLCIVKKVSLFSTCHNYFHDRVSDLARKSIMQFGAWIPYRPGNYYPTDHYRPQRSRRRSGGLSSGTYGRRGRKVFTTYMLWILMPHPNYIGPI